MPFFGVPIRNGLPIGLGSVAGFGVQQFDPSLLFEGGTVAGAWYDPSDLSTMFTTDAGTTPVAMPGLGAGVAVGLILDKSGNGNHARSFGAGLSSTRPELRARVNLLTYSEEFDNGAWTKSNVSEVAGKLAPDGTNTAFEITATTANGILRQQLTLTGADYTFSIWLRRVSGTGSIGISAHTGGTIVNVTLTSSWQRFDVTQTLTAGVRLPGVRISTSGDVIEAWGADLRPANIGANVPAYQRIADANTYDTSGFPLYLRFDGIDDSMYTPANLNLSGTDKVAVFAGVRKLSDANFGTVTELSAEATPNPGTFIMRAPQGAPAATYAFLHRGSVTMVEATTPSSYAAPITSVLSGLSNLGGPSVSIRVNGVQAASSTGFVGAGNYGTYPLFIGYRGNNSLFFNGHLYSLIIAGSAVSAGNISATEQWVAGKTGIQI